MGFEIIDISGDAGIRASGKTVAEAYENAGIGMYSLITDINLVDESISIVFQAGGDSPEGLLVSYLNELVFRFDAYGFIGRKIEVGDIRDFRMPVRVYGEKFETARHEQRLLIKAATYHNIKVRQTDGIWEVEVIFDI